MDEHTSLIIPAALVLALRQARHLVVLTGAGISAESGLPTFRDPLTGLWARYRPQELGTPQAFRRNPRLVWEWFAWRRQLVAAAEPNAGHIALAMLEQLLPKVTILTQNVDGLHQRAGSTNVIELHGNLARTKCFSENTPVDTWEASEELPPRCPRCGDFLRPNVVWFGEALAETVLNDATDASRASNVFLVIGTSGTVMPAAFLPYYAKEAGAMVAIINAEVTDQAQGSDYMLVGQAGLILPALLRAAWPEQLPSDPT